MGVARTDGAMEGGGYKLVARLKSGKRFEVGGLGDGSDGVGGGHADHHVLLPVFERGKQMRTEGFHATIADDSDGVET